MLEALAQRHPGSVGVRIGFDDGGAPHLCAGSDFLLMPSRFEPCGLGQMYAQRFGSLPIAHRTGGLADTIEDGVTGFLFGELSLRDFVRAIRRGAAAFHSSTRLASMRKAAMERPQGWAQAGKQYADVYRHARRQRRRPERGRSVSPPKELRSGNRWPENTWNRSETAR